jgi:6-phosphogluconolactonase (cycloisomerase 2 family)
MNGGQNTADPPFQLPDNQFVLGLNLEYDRQNNLASRLGVADVIGEAAAATEIEAIIASADLNDPRWVELDTTNNILFISNFGGSTVTLIDVTDVEAPVPISSVSTQLSSPQGMAHDPVNFVLYVASGINDRVCSYDYTDKFNPTFLDSFTSTDDAQMNAPRGMAIDLTNSILWVACHDSDTLMALDISTPSVLAHTGEVTDAVNLNGAFDVAINSGFTEAYVTASNGNALSVCDISTPATPTVSGTVTDATALNSCGKIVYAEALEQCYGTAVGGTGTRIWSVDVTTPATPAVSDHENNGTSNPDNADNHGGLTYDGGLLFTSLQKQDVLQVWDVSDVDDIQLLGEIANSDLFDSPQDMVYDPATNIAYVVDSANNKLIILEFKSSAKVTTRGTLQTQAADNYEGPILLGRTDDLTAYAWDDAASKFVKWTGTRSAGASFDSDLTVHPANVINAENRSKGTIFRPSTKTSDYIALAGFHNDAGNKSSFSIFDISGNSWASTNNLLNSNSNSDAIAYYNDHLFIVSSAQAGDGEYLSVWDVTDPDVPLKVGLLGVGAGQSLADFNGLQIARINETDQLLFIVEDVSGDHDKLHVIDISDVTQPAHLSTTTLGSGANEDVAVDGLVIHPVFTQRYIYTNVNGVLYVYSYTAAGVVTLVRNLNMPGNNGNLFIGENGNILISSPQINQGEVHFYSITSPDKPFHLAEFTDSDSAGTYIAARGHNKTFDDDLTTGMLLFAFELSNVADGSTRRECRILDARALQPVTFKGQAVNIPMDAPEAIASDGQTAYVVSSTSDALVIIDVNDIERPTVIGTLTDGTNLNGANSVVIINATTLVVGMPGRITSVDITDPTAPAVLNSITPASIGSLNSIVYGGGQYVYTIGSGVTDAIAVIDVSTPASLSATGSLTDAAFDAAQGIAVNTAETRAWTVSGDDIVTVNISVKSTPVIAADTDFATDLTAGSDVAWEDDELFVTDSTDDALVIFDVSSDTPTKTGRLTSATNLAGAKRVWKEPDQPRVFVSAPGDDRVTIVDVTDTTTPVVLSSFQDADNLADAFDVYGRGAAVFAVDKTGDRFVIVGFQGLPFSVDVTSIYQFDDPDTDDDASTLDDRERKIILTAGTNLFEFNLTTGEVTNRTGSVDISDGTLPWTWRTLDGKALGTNGELMVSWTGGNFFVKNNDESLPTNPKYLEIWNKRAFLAGGTTLYYSALGAPLDFTSSTAGAIDIDADFDGDITGIYAHKGFLFIFKRNSIFRIQTGVPNTDETRWSVENVTRNLGCLSNWSIQTVLDDLLFLSGSGIASMAMSETVGDFESSLASRPIKELRDVSQAEEQYVSVVDDLTSQYWISIPVSGVDTTFVLDFKNAQQGQLRWTEFQGKIVGSYYATILDADGEKQILIAGDKTIYRRKREGDTNPWDDAGDAYTKTFKSKFFDFGAPSERKEIDRWGFEVEKFSTSSTLTLASQFHFDQDTAALQSTTFNMDAVSGVLPVFRKLWPRRRLRTLQVQLQNTKKEGFALDHYWFDAVRLTHRRTSAV